MHERRQAASRAFVAYLRSDLRCSVPARLPRAEYHESDCRKNDDERQYDQRLERKTDKTDQRDKGLEQDDNECDDRENAASDGYCFEHFQNSLLKLRIYESLQLPLRERSANSAVLYRGGGAFTCVRAKLVDGPAPDQRSLAAFGLNM